MPDDEIQAGAAPVVDTVTPADNENLSLDAAINAALDAHDAPADDAPAADGRARDEQGRFAPKSPEAEGSAPAVAEAAPVGLPTEPVKAQADPAAAPATAAAWTDGHFTGWKPEQREAFSKMPPEAQKLLMDRQAESQAFYQRKLSEETAFKQQLQPLQEAAQNASSVARTSGMQPHELLNAYVDHEKTLQFGTLAQKVDLVNRICAHYKIPLQPQAEPDPFADPLSPVGAAYPVVHDLQSQLRQTQAELQAMRSNLETQTQSRITSEIEGFATAKDPTGQPLYPWFDTVKPMMGQLMSSGQAQTLADAYALAVKPINDRIAADAAARQKAAEDQQRQQIERARKAAPVRTSGVAPGGKTSGGSLDSVINAALTQAGIH